MPNVNEKTVETTTAKPNAIAKETKVLDKKDNNKSAKTVVKKEKKTRAPRARKVEELINEATKKMTDKEKDILIKFLREDSTKMKNQITALRENIEAAYAKVNKVEEQYNAMEAFYRKNLEYIDGQVIAFTNAVRKSTVGGVN